LYAHHRLRNAVTVQVGCGDVDDRAERIGSVCSRVWRPAITVGIPVADAELCIGRCNVAFHVDPVRALTVRDDAGSCAIDQLTARGTVVGVAVTVTVSGFCANSTVVFTGGGATLGQATSNASGAASLTFNAPTTAGTFVVTATSSGACVASASASLAVSAPSTPIPATGSNSTQGLQFGALAIGAGVVLTGLASFRRRRHLAAA
jgi:hypothetical protein